tara:strand:- start:415 stop:744 length:330 start_codon:yes stop_codon:yes gene_type:complete
VKVRQPEGDNNFIYGILYGDKAGDLYLLNDNGSHRVVMDIPDSMLLPANQILETTTTDIQWKKSGEIETWDSNILADLLHDMQSEGQNPEQEIVYVVKDRNTIVVSSND